MAKKSDLDFPDECCGVCKYSHMVEKDLQCFGMPPQIMADTEGDIILCRSAVVEPADFPCHLFSPRKHS